MNPCQKPVRASKQEYREVENDEKRIPLICFSYCLCKPTSIPTGRIFSLALKIRTSVFMKHERRRRRMDNWLAFHTKGWRNSVARHYVSLCPNRRSSFLSSLSETSAANFSRAEEFSRRAKLITRRSLFWMYFKWHNDINKSI